MTTTITVLGGRGYLGSITTSAARAIPGAEVTTASRSGDLAVDLTRPATFTALDRAGRVVVDLTDATTTPPDELIAACLDRGLTVIEATSDAEVVRRLDERFRAHPRGLLVLGGGIFTGLSNLLARQVVRRAGSARSLSLAISSSPFSAAGTGTIELMIASVARPVYRIEGGRRVDQPRPSFGPTVDFGSARRRTIRVGFPEAHMLHRSTGVPDVEVLFAPRPASLLTPAFVAMPGWLSHTRAGQAFLRGYFTVVRKYLLGWRAAGVQLTASATAADGTVHQAWLDASDGMAAGGYALAAMAEALAGDPSATGVKFIDDLLELEPVVQRANQLAGKALIRLPGSAPALAPGAPLAAHQGVAATSR